MDVPRVTVNLINVSSKDRIDDAGAEMHIQAIDFDSARDRIVVAVGVWSKTSKDAREVESLFRVPLSLDLHRTLQEVVDLAKDEVCKTLCFSKETRRE